MVRMVSLIAPTKAFNKALRKSGIVQPLYAQSRRTPTIKGVNLLEILRKAETGTNIQKPL